MNRFDHFLKKTCPEFDLNWRKYRRRGARRRLEARIRELNLPDYDAYREYLHTHPKEAKDFPEYMAVTVTRFFRDRHCWEELVHPVLDTLLQRFAPSTFRVLSAGCCGGEEAYSLAMVWKEEMERNCPKVSLSITAVDLNPCVLKRAGEGVYGKSTLRELPEPYKKRWFSEGKGGFILNPEIKNMVRLLRANLNHAPLAHPHHLILCRYLFLTYYTGKRRRNMLEKLWGLLVPGGVLMIGAKEQLPPSEHDLFFPWKDTGCMYKRTEKV